jgi:predicted RNA binding protein YcfA (HicA-like mRNA interferase family)
MDSLPVIKPRVVVNALLRGGFYLHHQTGSHVRLVHETRPDLRVTVPIHSKDIPKGTLRRIIRQANLTVEEFLQLLD